MSTVSKATRNEELVRRSIDEMMNKRNAALVDEFFAPDCVEHPLWYQPTFPQWMEGKSVVEAMKQYFAKDDPNYQNLHVTIDRMISAGEDTVVLVWTLKGTRNGKQIIRTGMEIDRLEGGKIVEIWFLWDRLGLFQQLGVVPATPELIKQAGLEM